MQAPCSKVVLAEVDDVSQASQTLFAAMVLKEHSLRLAAGMPTRPWFETVSLVDAESGEAEASVVVPRRAGNSTLMGEATVADGKGKKRSVGEHADVAVIGTSEMALPTARDGAQGTPRRTRQELSLGQRAADASVVMEDAPATPKADSSAVVLTQALQNDDTALLEDCLSCRDHTLITNTVRRLPATSVLPFLKQVASRVRSKPGRASTLVFWIRAVLTEHTAYLTSVPAAGAVLAELFQAADARLDVFGRFLKLQGRLDLIMTHISHRRRADDTAGDGSMGPATFVHRETGGEDEDEEDEEDDEEDGAVMDLEGLDEDDESDDEEDEDDEGEEDEIGLGDSDEDME